jgi:hypothetical protein
MQTLVRCLYTHSRRLRTHSRAVASTACTHSCVKPDPTHAFVHDGDRTHAFVCDGYHTHALVSSECHALHALVCMIITACRHSCVNAATARAPSSTSTAMLSTARCNYLCTMGTTTCTYLCAKSDIACMLPRASSASISTQPCAPSSSASTYLHATRTTTCTYLCATSNACDCRATRAQAIAQSCVL